MQVGNQTVVTIDYTLTDDGGEILDTSRGGKPLSYIHGSGTIITGLENALTGKAAGDVLQVKVPPADGYGERDEELVQAVPRNRFPGEEIEVGTRFHAQGSAGSSRVVTVVALDDDSVTVDANHPLAGMTLSFDVTVVDVREATADEIQHGHVHGSGDHDHDHDHDHG